MKIKLFLIPIIFIIGILGYYFFPKTITITLPQNKAVLVFKNKEYTSPVTIKRKTGNFTFILKAEGFETERPTIKVGWNIKQSYTVKLDLKTGESGDDAAINSKDFPFIEKLPQMTDHYKIDLNETTGEIEIDLFAVLNRPEQLDEYEVQIKQYGNEALSWLRANGADLNKIKIKWSPEKPKGI